MPCSSSVLAQHFSGNSVWKSGKSYNDMPMVLVCSVFRKQEVIDLCADMCARPDSCLREARDGIYKIGSHRPGSLSFTLLLNRAYFQSDENKDSWPFRFFSLLSGTKSKAALWLMHAPSFSLPLAIHWPHSICSYFWDPFGTALKFLRIWLGKKDDLRLNVPLPVWSVEIRIYKLYSVPPALSFNISFAQRLFKKCRKRGEHMPHDSGPSIPKHRGIKHMCLSSGVLLSKSIFFPRRRVSESQNAGSWIMCLNSSLNYHTHDVVFIHSHYHVSKDTEQNTYAPVTKCFDNV